MIMYKNEMNKQILPQAQNKEVITDANASTGHWASLQSWVQS